MGIEEFSVWKDGCEDSVDGIGVGKGRALRKWRQGLMEIREIREIRGAGMAEGREGVDILIVGFCLIG